VYKNGKGVVEFDISYGACGSSNDGAETYMYVPLITTGRPCGMKLTL
jgi:hypothetical protein